MNVTVLEQNLLDAHDNIEALMKEFKRNGLISSDQPDKIILLLLYFSAFLLAVFGNGLVIILASKYRRMRTRKNIFLLNLSLADLGVTLFCIPAEISRNIYPYWIFGVFMCKFTFYLQAVTCLGSVFTLVAMGIDRMVTASSTSYRNISAFRLGLILSTIWLAAIVTPIPVFLNRQLHVEKITLFNNASTELVYCRENWSSRQHQMGYSYSVFVLSFVLPFLFITVCYLYVARMISRASRMDSIDSNYSDSSLQSSNLSPNRSRQALHMVVTLVIIFFVCWFPFNINVIIVDVRMYDSVSNASIAAKVLPYTLLLGYLHSALSPIIYWFVNTSFQHTARRLFLVVSWHSSRKSSDVRLQLQRAMGRAVNAPPVRGHYSMQELRPLQNGGKVLRVRPILRQI